MLRQVTSNFGSKYPTFTSITKLLQDKRDNNWEYPGEFCIPRQQVFQFPRRFHGTEINITDLQIYNCFTNFSA